MAQSVRQFLREAQQQQAPVTPREYIRQQAAQTQPTTSPAQTVTPQPVTPTPQTTTPSFLNNLFETLGIAATQAQRATTGVQAPVETQRAENNRLAELGAARAGAAQERKRLEELRKPTEWDGRDELIQELKDFRASSNPNLMTAAERKAELDRRQDIIDQLRAGDEAAGNAPRDYTAGDRLTSVLSGWGQRTAGNLGNAATTIGRAVGEAQARQQLNSNDQFLIDWMLGEDTRARAQEYEDAIRSDEYNQNWENVQRPLDELADTGNASIARAKEGMGTVGRLGVDIGIGALDLGADALANAIAPGSGMISMAGRVFGEAAREQRQKGGSQEQQLLAGTKAAAIEVLTEKIAGPFEKIYGKSFTGKAIKEALDGLDNRAVKAALKILSDAAGESVEEILSDIANPVADHILNLDEAGNTWGDVMADLKDSIPDMLYDGLIGGILGAAGGAVNVANGRPTREQVEAIKQQAAQAAINAVDNAVTAQTETTAESAPLNPADLLAEQVTGPAQEAAETPAEAAQPVGDIPAPPTTAESTTAQPQALNYASLVGTHIDERSNTNLGSISVKAFQYDNPQIRPFYKKAAETLKSDLQYSVSSDAKGVSKKGGTQIAANSFIREAMRRFGMSRNEMIAACDRIIHDEGQENVAAAKRIELLLDDMLTNGYTPTDKSLPKLGIDSGYIAAKAALSGEAETDYRFRKAVEGEIKTALMDGVELTQEEAAAAVRARFEQTGYYSLGEQFTGEGRDSIIDSQEGGSENDGRSQEVYPVQNGAGVEEGAAQPEMPGYDGSGAVRAYQQEHPWGELTQEQQRNAQEAVSKAAKENPGGSAAKAIEQFGDQTAEVLWTVYNENGPEHFSEVAQALNADPTELLSALDAANPQSTVTLAVISNTDVKRDDGDGNPPTPPGGGDGGLTVPGQAGLKRSQTESNTLSGVAEKLGGKQESLYYVPITERQTMTEAMNRVNADMVGEMNGLADKEMWTAADIDTGMTIYGMLKADAVRTGDNTAANAWAKVVQSRGTKSGQALQAFSKWTRSATGQASYAADQIAEASNLSSEEKTRITNDIYDFAAEIDGVEVGDVSSLREIIKRQSDYRGTGTIFEKNFEKILDQITDYEYLREYAQRQLMSMASDATETATLGDKLKTWQVSAQLSRLGTFFRNIGGNVLFGAQDTLTQDGLGVALDWLVSKGTGKRTVGLDKSWFSAEARKGAKEAMLRSILEVAGDVNMDGDTSKYGTTANRTNKMSGGKFSQFMSRWEQILGYSLTTSDRTSRGSIETAIRESLKNSGLTDAEIDAIAEGTADYRLFQNQDLAYKVSKGLHDVMNLVGVGGEVRGVTRSGGFGAGDLVSPYPGVPANLAVKAFEYSPANIVKGGVELFNLFRDIKNGTYDATKQNRAVMDIARGMAGTPIIALLAAAFKTGIIKNPDDEDDLDVAAQNRAEGKSGVQINLDAWNRAIKGESAEWKDGDDLLSIGWLEPMNAFMAIASMIAAEDELTIETVGQDYFAGAIQSVLEIPSMGTIANVVDSFRYSTAEKVGDKFIDAGIGFLGDAVSGMIPAPISQAARTSDLYFRDTGGDSKAEQVINNILNNIPGARQTLPTKLDNFGRPKEYSNSAAQRFLNNFVLPGAVNELNQSDESKALEQLREASGETSFYPDRKAPSKVNLPGENGNGESVKLTTEEKRAYQEAYGGTYTDLLSSLLTGGAWDGMTTEAQTATAKAIEAYAKDEAKRAIAEAQGREYKSDFDDERELPADSLADYFGAKESLKLARDNKDYSTLDALIDTLDEYPKAVRDKLSEDITRLDDMKAAADKGINSEEWTRAYDQYKAINKKDEGATDKAEEMKTWLRTGNWTKSERELLESQFKYYTSTPAEAKTYDKLDAALDDPKKAQHYSGLVRSEDADNAAEVLTAISNDRQYSLEDKEKALSVYLTESQYAAYERAKAENISMGNWAKFLTEVSKAHVERTGKGGNPSKADIQAACNAMGWTTKADFDQVYKVYKGN